MNGSIGDIEAQRARWRHYRQGQALTLDAGDGFAAGGLGRNVDNLDLRVLILPGDPEGEALALDGDVLAWLQEERATPCGGRPVSWGNRWRGTSFALLVYDHYREDSGWARYLAIHRHGGIEIGVSKLAYQVGEARVFPLRSVVAVAWVAAELQNAAMEQWAVPGPFELTVAIRDANSATLGQFAEGWKEPGQGLFDPTTCIEDHLLLRRECDDTIDAENYALALGDQLEQAFGTTHRRHLAHRGEYEGQFDPRVYLF